MSKDQYLRMCEQTGEEIDWEKCPPEIEDFPESIIRALNIFESLGVRVYPDVGYVGRDWIFELLLFLDSRAIQESQKRMKAEMDRIKRK